MRRTMQMSVLAAGFAAALAFGGASAAQAAPVTTGAAAVKHATSSDVTDVQYRGRRAYRAGRYYGRRYYGRRYYPGAAIAGAAAGIIGLAAAEALAPRYYYYGAPGPYYYRPYYGPRYYRYW